MSGVGLEDYRPLPIASAKHAAKLRRIARILIAMRHAGMGIAVAEIREDEKALAFWNGTIDGLATGLPISLRGSIALARYGLEPTKRIIARRGILAVAEDFPLGRIS